MRVAVTNVAKRHNLRAWHVWVLKTPTQSSKLPRAHEYSRPICFATLVSRTSRLCDEADEGAPPATAMMTPVTYLTREFRLLK